MANDPVQIIRGLGMCADVSPDGQRVCILDIGHREPHPWPPDTVEDDDRQADMDNHHNAAKCPYCTHNGEFVMVPSRSLDTVRQGVADGEVNTTQPVSRALRDLFAWAGGGDDDA